MKETALAIVKNTLPSGLFLLTHLLPHLRETSPDNPCEVVRDRLSEEAACEK